MITISYITWFRRNQLYYNIHQSRQIIIKYISEIVHTGWYYHCTTSAIFFESFIKFLSIFYIYLKENTKTSVYTTKPWFNGHLIKNESANKYTLVRAHVSKAVAHIQIYSSRIITKKPIHKQFLLRTSAIETSSASRTSCIHKELLNRGQFLSK